MKRFTFFLLIMAGITAFSFAQTAGAAASGSGAFHQEGIASWYGSEFDGKPTASGEIFSSDSFTAAHPTIPFGTVLTVTNTQNNQRVNVRINDRGPFVASRIIDLSRAAAEVLDMLTTGTAPVIVEQAVDTTLGPAGEAPPAPVAVTPEPAPEPTPVAAVIPETAPAPAPIAAPEPVPAVSTEEIPQSPQATQPSPPPVTEVPLVAVTPREEASPPPPQVQAAPQTQSPPPQAPVWTPPPPAMPERAETPPPSPPPMVAVCPMPAARILGGIPPAGSVKTYRLQVGAYKVPRNAVDAFDKLNNAGLKPAYEQYGDLYRVVLPGLRASQIPSIAQTLGNAGFQEALIREEN